LEFFVRISSTVLFEKEYEELDDPVGVDESDRIAFELSSGSSRGGTGFNGRSM
jgi:hypothetical protein